MKGVCFIWGNFRTLFARSHVHMGLELLRRDVHDDRLLRLLVLLLLQEGVNTLHHRGGNGG